jgi:uncharacterized protein YggE
MTRHVTAEGTGRREAMPDLATVELTATGDGDAATVARETARDRAATIEASLSVSADRVRTVDCRIEDGAEPFEPDIDARYRATVRLVVDCVPETAGSVVAEATDAGGTVESVDFHLHEDIRRELRDEALAAAMERAREKAERVAAVEGLTVAEVAEVTVGGTGSEMEDLLDGEPTFGPGTDFEPTPVAVTGTVEAEFELA